MRNLRVLFREHKEVSSPAYEDKLGHVVLCVTTLDQAEAKFPTLIVSLDDRRFQENAV